MRADLSGKVALVTGAGRGIGAAIAGLLAANGCLVAASDLDGASAAAIAAGLPCGLGLAMDVRDEAAIAAGMAAILERFGRLDILVNNAGVNTLVGRAPIDAFPLAEWRRVIGVDLEGVFLVSRHALAPMLRQGSGRVINIASIAGLVALRLQCAFAAAKAGVVNLTRAMAIELAPRGVLVNAVAPGSTLTDATRALFYDENGAFSASAEALLAHIPLRRPARPEEIAQAVLFLAAPASSAITGHILTVDGGWTAGFAA